MKVDAEEQQKTKTVAARDATPGGNSRPTSYDCPIAGPAGRHPLHGPLSVIVIRFLVSFRLIE